jgi:hemolysin activation/secretion protein
LARPAHVSRAGPACICVAWSVLALAWAPPAHTQQPPSAGDALRDIQEKPAVPQTGAPPIEVAPERRRAVKPVDGVEIDVKTYRFTGLSATRAGELQPIVAEFTGGEKTFDDLQAAADAVSEYLQRQGYFVAQAYLPEQKIHNGVVEIAVLEGRLAKVAIEMEDGVPVSREIIESLVSGLVPGTVMHRDTVERALFLVSDLRGLNVRSIVEPGPEPGTSNLVLKVSAGRRIDGLIEFDNHSSRFTGDYRLGGGVNFNSPMGRGDLLSFRGLLGVPGGGADLDFGRVSYLAPVGPYGTKLGAAYLRVNYHLGTSLFDPLDQSGRSEVLSFFGLHPFIRGRNLNLFAQGSFDNRDFEDDRRAVGIRSERRTRVGSIGMVGDSRDALLGGGINNFSLGYTRGDLDIESPADRAADQSTLGQRTAGSYSRVNGSLARLNSIGKNAALFASYSFQWASKNLDASEKMALGGPNAVRAYGVGEATSDAGHLFTAEIRFGMPKSEHLPGNFVASAFFDYGRGRLNEDPLPLQVVGNTRTLRGAGVGLTWANQDDFLFRAMLAWRLSDAPVSDPVDRRPRLFFQLQKYL